LSGFLARWARRKAAAAQPAPAPVAPVDESTLPALETLTGDSDITAFLAAGVSPALQSQALRIAWRDDARIAGFRGLADYDWDFNAEGYGRLAAADDVAALLQRILSGDSVADERSSVLAAKPPPLVGGGWGRGGAELGSRPSAPSPRPPPTRGGGAIVGNANGICLGPSETPAETPAPAPVALQPAAPPVSEPPPAVTAEQQEATRLPLRRHGGALPA